MRLKSEIWVKAYIRRCQHEGVAAVLGRRGDADAGAIYIKVSRLDGSALLFGPAPSGLDEAGEERRWEPSLGGFRWPRPRLMPICSGKSRSIPISGSWLSRTGQAGTSSRIG